MGDLVNIFLQNIAPIMLIATLAYIIGRLHDIDPRPLGRASFYLFSPAFLFTLLATTDILPAELLQISGTMILFAMVMTGIAFAASVWRGINPTSRAGLILSAMCPNNGNFGLPLIAFAFGETVVARAAIIVIIMVFWNNIAGVFIASSSNRSLRAAALQVMHVPSVYAALAGLAVNLLDISLAPALQRPIGLLGQAAIPTMLVVLGLQLTRVQRISDLKLVSVGVGIRLLLSPLVAVGLVRLLNIPAPASTAIIMQASMPVAVMTIIYASEFGLDDQFASSTVLASTLLSPITLSVLVFLLQNPA